MWLTALGGNLLTVGGTSDPQGAISNSTGNVTISNNLVVTSISDLQSTISNSTRNVTIGDNLTVTGATTTKRRTWPPQLPPPFRRQTRLRSLASLSPICVTGISTFRRSLPRRQSPANHHRSHERMSYGWRDYFPPAGPISVTRLATSHAEVVKGVRPASRPSIPDESTWTADAPGHHP